MPTTTAKYRLLAGGHSEAGNEYEKGEIIETENDLVAMFGAEKFQLISGKPRFNGKRKVNLRALRDQLAGGKVPMTEVKGSAGNVKKYDADGNPVNEHPAEDDGEETITHDKKRNTGDDDARAKAGLPPKDAGEEDGDDAGADTAEQPDFDKMTVQQLKDFAGENGIDLKHAKSKAEIIKALEDAA